MQLRQLTSVVMGLLGLVVSAASLDAQVILRVDANVSGGSRDGSSWANAFKDLSAALKAPNAVAGTEIWVANGTYVPDPAGLADPRAATFSMATAVAVVGGFEGADSTRYPGGETEAVSATRQRISPS